MLHPLDWHRCALLILACSLLAITSLSAADPAGSKSDDARLAEILKSFDEVQNSVHTLSATFTETTTNVMLLDPVVSEGRFYMTKPTAIRWEYSSPESMQFIIESDTYTGYFPERKRAETKNIRRWREHLFRFFGLGQGSEELKKFYQIRLAEQQPEDEILLILVPKRKRARRKIEQVKFWIDPQRFMPSRIEYSTSSGNGRMIVFDTIQINPELAASLFHVELPDDVTVTHGFSGLPDFDASSVQ